VLLRFSLPEDNFGHFALFRLCFGRYIFALADRFLGLYSSRSL
jgi:hypothetical protein